MPRTASVLGLVAMIGIAWLCSTDRRRISWRTVGWGIALQFFLGVVLLKTPVGRLFFSAMNALTTWAHASSSGPSQTRVSRLS